MRANRDRLAVLEAVALKHRKIILLTTGLNEPSGRHRALQEPSTSAAHAVGARAGGWHACPKEDR
jgi:hypothetical protein